MRSVKGMTWGSPEFVKLAELAEAEANVDERIEGISDAVDSLIDDRGFTRSWQQLSALTTVREDLTEILGLYDEEWERCE